MRVQYGVFRITALLAAYRQVRWLTVAQASCLALISSIVVLFVAAIPVRFNQLVTTFANLSPAQELVLEDLGVSGALSVGLIFGIELLVAAAFIGVGLLIFSRRSDDMVALYVAAALPAYVVWVSPSIDALTATPGPLSAAASAVQALGFVMTIVFFYIFPTGRFTPSWTRWMVPSLIAWAVAWVVFGTSPYNMANPFRLPMESFLVLMAWLVSGTVAQLYRHAHANPIQRQQTKLILLGACIAVAGYLLFGFDRFALTTFREAHLAGVVYDLVGVPLFLLTVLAVPVCFAMSILRYKLWEIEELLSRAFMYTFLTALLGGLYTASITLSQRLFVALTGEKSDAAIVVTTLLVASSFTPIKNALQGAADRHVKHKPDPTRSLKTFVDQLRAVVEDIDPEELTRRGLEEAIRAFSASSGAVYLLRDGHYRLARVSGAWDQVEGMTAWLDWNGSRYGWIALAPRRMGTEYTRAEQATFQELVTLVARAIWLLTGSAPTAGPADERCTLPMRPNCGDQEVGGNNDPIGVTPVCLRTAGDLNCASLGAKPAGPGGHIAPSR
jgi:hypothetical protein